MGLFGAGGLDRLSNTWPVPIGSRAARDSAALGERYGFSGPDLVLLLSTTSDVRSPEVAAAGRAVEEEVRRSPGVGAVSSYWSANDPALISRDARSALVSADLTGEEALRAGAARRLVAALGEHRGPLTITPTGAAWTLEEILEDNRADLLRAELISAPACALILLFVFRSLVAALLPVVSALIATAGTLAFLRLLTSFTEVSVYASNIATALGLGLAVDYGILVVSRFREESTAGVSLREAVERSVRTAGRAVVVSAGIVLACVSSLLVFPFVFLRSAAWAAVAVVVFSAAASVIVVPALLALLGRNTDRFDLFARLRRRNSRGPEGSPGWRRATLAVTRRPVVAALAAACALTAMSLPAWHVSLGPSGVDDLPHRSRARTAAVIIRQDFASAPERELIVGLPKGTPREEVEGRARTVSALPQTAFVRTFTGRYRGGTKVEAPGPWDTRQDAPAGPVMVVASRFPPGTERSAVLVRQLRTLPAHGHVLVAGRAAEAVDSLSAVRRALPWCCGVVAAATFVLMALFTRSLLVPFKAVVVAAMSLGATLGCLVYVFQDGHLRSVVGDFHAPGYLSDTTTVFLLATAYALAVDYEVFIVARIREEFLASGDNTAAVVAGMQRTGRLVTAASLVFAAAMAGPATSGVTSLKLTGTGLALAVVVDAVVVRGALVPGLMTLAGRANWWLPRGWRRRSRRTAGRANGSDMRKP
ncbi:MMPL family transporter [Streptomyces rectiverticillatus]|uniref:MMPL family transporter n=1 Tax=Streptomyces rectiverticillatus TaxID=173860 RepID=UPI0015C30923|nr:MMPL family transporter [Streptomyces rectiverticillatus]QLE70263.1 MMPL family transporter [Streptomyces rectiverticillatus]